MPCCWQQHSWGCSLSWICRLPGQPSPPSSLSVATMSPPPTTSSVRPTSRLHLERHHHHKCHSRYRLASFRRLQTLSARSAVIPTRRKGSAVQSGGASVESSRRNGVREESSRGLR